MLGARRSFARYATMGSMRLRIFTEPQQGASYGTLRRVAKAAEDLGFDAFFRSDHYLRMGDGSGEPGPTDAWATLAALAVETSTIRLGTLVTAATFRLPGPLAITVAQVDEMSGGRVEFGLGTGWYDGEHRAYGIPFPPLKERFDRFEEQLAIITGLWSTPVGPDVLLRRRVLLAHGLARAAQAGSAAEGAGDHRRRRRRAAPRPSPPATPTSSTRRSGPSRTRPPRSTGCGSACAEAGRDPASMTFSAAQVVCCGKDEAELARRAAAIGRDLSELRSTGLVGTAVGGRRQDRRATPRPAPPPSTCRSSTSPTSTTWTCSPPRYCPRSSTAHHQPPPDRLRQRHQEAWPLARQQVAGSRVGGVADSSTGALESDDPGLLGRSSRDAVRR